MSFVLLYKGKKKIMHNVEDLIEIAKQLPERCIIVDEDDQRRVIWETADDTLNGGGR